MDIEGLLGALHIGLIIADDADDDFVHIPVKNAKELIICLEDLKMLLSMGGDRNEKSV